MITMGLMKRNIGVGTVNITAKHRENVLKILENARLTYGPFTKKFEQLFSKAHECSHAVMCSSGTSALRMGIHAFKELHDWNSGDEVLVPAVTFVASSNVVMQNGLKPVFVDVHPKYYNIDPVRIEEKITSRTKAIMPVHLFGMPCDMDKIMAIAQKYGLKVIEDSCETMLAKYKGKSVGSFGDISCFSTYAAHLIVTGVGGIACTNNEQYAVKMRSLMNHGRNPIYLNIDDDNYKSEPELREIVLKRFTFESIGYSDRVTELEAGLGLAELELLPQNISIRQSNAGYLKSKLARFENFLQLPEIHQDCTHSFMMFPIVVKGGIERNELVFFLENHGIETRGMLPLLNQPAYRKLFGDIEREYPVAKMINECGFYIGCHQNLTKADLDYVVGIFEQYFSQN